MRLGVRRGGAMQESCGAAVSLLLRGPPSPVQPALLPASPPRTPKFSRPHLDAVAGDVDGGRREQVQGSRPGRQTWEAGVDRLTAISKRDAILQHRAMCLDQQAGKDDQHRRRLACWHGRPRTGPKARPGPSPALRGCSSEEPRSKIQSPVNHMGTPIPIAMPCVSLFCRAEALERRGPQARWPGSAIVSGNVLRVPPPPPRSPAPAIPAEGSKSRPVPDPGSQFMPRCCSC